MTIDRDNKPEASGSRTQPNLVIAVLDFLNDATPVEALRHRLGHVDLTYVARREQRFGDGGSTDVP